jgi:hypothetical protein
MCHPGRVRCTRKRASRPRPNEPRSREGEFDPSTFAHRIPMAILKPERRNIGTSDGMSPIVATSFPGIPSSFPNSSTTAPLLAYG